MIESSVSRGRAHNRFRATENMLDSFDYKTDDNEITSQRDRHAKFQTDPRQQCIMPSTCRQNLPAAQIRVTLNKNDWPSANLRRSRGAICLHTGR